VLYKLDADSCVCLRWVSSAVFLSRRGWYCEIPLISEGVYMQIEQAEQMMAGG